MTDMQLALDLRAQAQAVAARKPGRARRLRTRAVVPAVRAAEAADTGPEPQRSLTASSAAVVALEAGRSDVAETLCLRALAGTEVPRQVEQELLQLLAGVVGEDAAHAVLLELWRQCEQTPQQRDKSSQQGRMKELKAALLLAQADR